MQAKARVTHVGRSALDLRKTHDIIRTLARPNEYWRPGLLAKDDQARTAEVLLMWTRARRRARPVQSGRKRVTAWSGRTPRTRRRHTGSRALSLLVKEPLVTFIPIITYIHPTVKIFPLLMYYNDLHKI